MSKLKQFKKVTKKGGKNEKDLKEKNDEIAKTEYIDNTRNQLTETFKRYDKNGDGILDKREIKLAIKELDKEKNSPIKNFTDEEIENMFTKLDRNNDGKIDFMEFLSLLLEF